MEKNEINVLLDEMCNDMMFVEVSRNCNISKRFFINLGKLASEENILQHIVERMENEDVPYLDEALCFFTEMEGLDLTEAQMRTLAKVTTKSGIYKEEDIICCIVNSVNSKLSKPTIRIIARTLERCADDFFSSYIDKLWDNIFQKNISKFEKEKAKKIYEETKEWFFDEGWL